MYAMLRRGILGAPDGNTVTGIQYEGSNGVSQVLTVRRGEDIPPVDGDGFLAYAQQFETPSVYNAIRDAERLGEIARFGLPESKWRHFGRLAEFPRGLIPFGDAICRLNPVWGRGIAVALKEAHMLHRVLQTQALAATPVPRWHRPSWLRPSL
jgi:flavin-dependent dehydrogenase